VHGLTSTDWRRIIHTIAADGKQANSPGRSNTARPRATMSGGRAAGRSGGVLASAATSALFAGQRIAVKADLCRLGAAKNWPAWPGWR
jgi:hypothetical protein